MNRAELLRELILVLLFLICSTQLVVRGMWKMISVVLHCRNINRHNSGTPQPILMILCMDTLIFLSTKPKEKEKTEKQKNRKKNPSSKQKQTS